ncbi:MAG: hypothetical protein GX968_08625, partial [Tissierellia bacterium]|nr:hypothetical protein [Tissierellia bacterium]
MNKRFVSIILLVILVLGNTIAFAEPGDFIHTGLKKIYKHKSEKDSNELIQDVLDGVDVNKFYREVENGKYVNITEEERKQMAEIEKLLRDAGITNPNEIRNYLIENKEKLDRKFADIIGEIATSFEDIDDENKGKIQDYKGASDVFILTTDNYSSPEPGFKEGSTKIARLRLPTEANKWKIQISNEQVPPMAKDTILKDSIDYVSGRDISIEVGQYLVLYAVDNGNKIKAYANIKITENMINTPKELAPKIEIGNVSEGEKYAGAVVINKLGELPEGASKWQILISPIPVERVYKVQMSGAMDYRPGEDIIMAAENELHPISNSFKKYLVLVAVDNEGIVQAYNTFEINKNNISKAPTLLKENTHYKGPVPGNNDGTTKFTELHFGLNPDENMKDAETWKAWTSKNPIAVPKLNAGAPGAPGTVLYALDEIEASIGNYLLLAAVDENNKIKGYRIFHLTETMVKGQTAPQLEEEKHYYKPEKGLTEGTTRINKLNLGGIEGATKWMYKIGESLDDPIFNRVVSGSSDYIAGQNVRTNVDDDFLLLATDKEGKVKAFAKIKLDENMIKDPPPALLREGMNYIGPVKGENPGTTKFEALAGSDSIGHNPKWMYMISDEEPEIPELNSTVQGATEFEPKDSIGENLLPGKYLILLATENGKIKGYAIFRLNNANIKMPPAALLKEGDHYNKAEKGSGAGTTRITGLKSIGIDGVEQWRIKTNPEPFLKDGESLELNSIVPQANIYNDGNNIRVNTNDWILLLATDYSGRVKAYSQIKLNEENIRKPNAALLIPGTNYTEPEAGTEENTTRFRFLDTSTNVIDATKWMYKVGKTTFGPIELDSIVEDALPAVGSYKAGENIDRVSVGDYLLLLATDKDGKVKGYREFILLERNIRGGPARMLNEDNYEFEKGNRPGTTKFSKLVPLGMEGNIRWKYKLINKKLPEKEKPYLNSIIEDANFVAVGQDIVVNEIGGDYG